MQSYGAVPVSSGALPVSPSVPRGMIAAAQVCSQSLWDTSLPARPSPWARKPLELQLDINLTLAGVPSGVNLLQLGLIVAAVRVSWAY